jgi:hydrogenase expression/formation protein HypC
MCLAVAGRIVRVSGDGLQRMADADVGGASREVSLAMVPEAKTGDWVLVHSGYAFEVLGDEAAQELLDLTDEVGGHL